MYFPSLNTCVKLTILLVILFHNCEGVLDQIGYDKCIDQVKKRFNITIDSPHRKTYASYAFLHLREDDTCFKNSDNSTDHYAVMYYRRILEIGDMNPTGHMKTPFKYCRSKPRVGPFIAYFDERLGRYINNTIDACETQLQQDKIPFISEKKMIIKWIYENIVVEQLDEFFSKYTRNYVENCDKHIVADQTISPAEFCRESNTRQEPPVINTEICIP